MVAFPPCKINLGLQVLSKRSDGYHDIATCFCPVGWTDVLEILPSTELKFTQTGIPTDGKPEDNLCMKAYRSLGGLPPVHIHLHKIIPVGAGLGGGSSDAAHTLMMLNSMLKLGLTDQQLMEKALLLGSDCPFFIHGKVMVGTGRGEILSDIDLRLRELYVVLVKPDIHIGTAEAYQGISVGEARRPELRELLTQPIATWRHSLSNDFEASIFRKHPVIGDLKQRMYQEGALYASMSGSGSAVYGLFEKEISTKMFAPLRSWSGWL